MGCSILCENMRKHSQPIGGHPLTDTLFLQILVAWKYKPSQPIGDHPLWPCPLRVISNFVRRSHTHTHIYNNIYIYICVCVDTYSWYDSICFNPLEYLSSYDSIVRGQHQHFYPRSMVVFPRRISCQRFARARPFWWRPRGGWTTSWSGLILVVVLISPQKLEKHVEKIPSGKLT